MAYNFKEIMNKPERLAKSSCRNAVQVRVLYAPL